MAREKRPVRDLFVKLGVAVFLLVYVTTVAHAQTGKRWTLSFDVKDKDAVWLELRDDDPPNFSSRSNTIALARLTNMNFKRGDTSTSAHFEIAGEAGKIICDGVVNADGGAGRYTVRNDLQYIPQLEAMGVRFEDRPDDLVSFILNDLTLDYAKQMRAATDVLDAYRLLKMRKLQVTPDYIRSMNEAAGQKLSSEDVISAAKIDLTPEYVREIRSLRGDASIEEIVRLKKKDVPVEYVKASLKCRGDASLWDIARNRQRGRSACPTAY
jgi:hypothetical protein